MTAPAASQRGGAWLAHCMREFKAAKVQQMVRPYPGGAKGGNDAMPVRAMVATGRIVRGERIGTVRHDAVLTGERAAHLLRRVCRASPPSPEAALQPLTARSFDKLVSRLAALPSGATLPPHLLLSRDALLLTTALFAARSPVNAGVLPTADPLRAWADALPRRPPPMGALLHRGLVAGADFEPLPRRLRLGSRVRDVAAGEGVAAAATELMVQAVEAGDVDLADLRQPETEVALTETVLTNYFRGRPSALTLRQHEAQRARHGAGAAEEDALQLFMKWERQLQAHLIDTLLPALLGCTTPTASLARTEHETALLDSAAWRAEEGALRWAHFMTRSRAVNLNWRRAGPPRLALIPFVDMLNHTDGAHANVVFQAEEGGDVAVTASRPIEAGEELVMRYNHVGQRGCLFGDQPHLPTSGTGEAKSGRAGKAATVATEVHRIEVRQYREHYARDEDEEAALAPPSQSSPAAGRHSSSSGSMAAVAQQEMEQEVQWLWRFGFLRSREEKNREAALLWSRGLRSRIAHLTDVRRKGRPGEFVVGVPEGLQHLREQRARLERDRYGNHKVFPPQQQ